MGGMRRKGGKGGGIKGGRVEGEEEDLIVSQEQSEDIPLQTKKSLTRNHNSSIQVFGSSQSLDLGDKYLLFEPLNLWFLRYVR